METETFQIHHFVKITLSRKHKPWWQILLNQGCLVRARLSYGLNFVRCSFINLGFYNYCQCSWKMFSLYSFIILSLCVCLGKIEVDFYQGTSMVKKVLSSFYHISTLIVLLNLVFVVPKISNGQTYLSKPEITSS